MTGATRKITKPFVGLRCLACGDEGNLIVRIDDMKLICESCSEETTREEVEAMVSKFARLFTWIDSAYDLNSR